MIKSLSYVGFSSPAASGGVDLRGNGLQDVSDPSEEVTRLRMDDAPGVSLYMLAKRTRWNTSAGTLVITMGSKR